MGLISKLFGRDGDNPGDDSLQKSEDRSSVTGFGPVGEQEARAMFEAFKRYFDWKSVYIDKRLIDNNKWFKLQHWELIKGTKDANGAPDPVTGHLFSGIAGFHADMMDNYPEPNLLGREQGDAETAEMLTSIVPHILDKINFQDTWSRMQWQRGKHGTGLYCVVWDAEAENGLGEFKITWLDPLRVYWDPAVENIADSRYLFIITLMDEDVVRQMYPGIELPPMSDRALQVQDYMQSQDANINYVGKCVVVDCYERPIIDGKRVLHLTKLIDTTMLASTRNEPTTADIGLYTHGEYPIIEDILIPDDGCAFGLGLVDLAKVAQSYTDRLNFIEMVNAMTSGIPRYGIRKNGGVNKEELRDLSKQIIEFEGDLADNLREIQSASLPAWIVNLKQEKVEELKEIVANRDFNQGGVTGGVTAFGAIAALQEAGNKRSRDMIKGSYSAYKRLMYMLIEMIGQFYDDERKFRITGKDGNEEYVSFSNAGMKPQLMPPMVPGEYDMTDPETGAVVIDPMTGMAQVDPDKAKYRKPVFDIKVVPQKSNPYSREAQNQMAIQMFTAGMFSPEASPAALICLEMLQFEGKDKVIGQVRQNGDLFQQMQQMMQQMQMQQEQMGQMRGTMDQMAAIIEGTTGRPLDPGARNGGMA